MKAQNNFTTMAIPRSEEASTLSVVLKKDSHSLKLGFQEQHLKAILSLKMKLSPV